jgi:hypothetical protein
LNKKTILTSIQATKLSTEALTTTVTSTTVTTTKAAAATELPGGVVTS